MAIESGSGVTLTNFTVGNNTWSNALGNGGVGGISYSGSGLQITNAILWGNVGQNFSGSGATVSNSDVGTSNPDFVSATDYHLQTGSPAAGMGWN
jgi:hypothetical protein